LPVGTLPAGTTQTNLQVTTNESANCRYGTVAGTAYASLPNAFKYRQSLVSNCACKPEPWSDAEAERHRGYARTETWSAAKRGRATSRAATELPSPSQRNGYGPGIPFSSKRGSPAGLWR
jgi:hypothetical protein